MTDEVYKKWEEIAIKSVPDILKCNENYVQCFISGFIIGVKEVLEDQINSLPDILESLND